MENNTILSFQNNDEMDFNNLIERIIGDNLTFLFKHKFETILRNRKNIEKLEGDIVECGVWKGGASIFMGHLFPKKKLWACDSFEGFQSLNESLYKYNSEKEDTWNESFMKDVMTLPLDEVKNNFKRYGLEGNNIEFLKGYVKDTLHPDVCQIRDIALLRVDVDAYSATREVLEYLYPKVVKGGYIIFDDSEIVESNHAMRDYFKEKGIEVEYLHPITDEICINLPEASYDNDWRVAYPEGQSYGGKIIPCGMYIIKK